MTSTPDPAPALDRGGPAPASGDLLPASALTFLGGPRGRYVSGRGARWAVVTGWLVALVAIPMAAAVAERGHCIARGWDGTDQFWHGCFSDLPAQHQLAGLSGGVTAYLSGEARLDQPVLTGAVMAFVGGFFDGGGALAQTRGYFLAWAFLVTVLLMATVWLTAASRPRHLADAAHVALSPVIVLSALISGDVLGVALTAAALFAWSRRSLVPTGVLLGLAIAARTYPVLVLVALLVLAVRSGRVREAGRVVGATAATLAVVAAPLLLTSPGVVTAPYAAWWRAGPGLGSPWLYPELVGHPLPTLGGVALAVTGWIAAILAGAYLALAAPRRPSVAEVSLVVVGIALVTGTSVPVQASIWLLPLAALSGVRWRDHLVWATTEALHFVGVWLYVAGRTEPSRGIEADDYRYFLLLRLAGILWLVGRVWWLAWRRPAHDPDPTWPDDPDRDEVVDELAGVLRDQPDAVIVTTR